MIATPGLVRSAANQLQQSVQTIKEEWDNIDVMYSIRQTDELSSAMADCYIALELLKEHAAKFDRVAITRQPLEAVPLAI